ncbi:glycosyl hydrolase-related protein [Microbacterium sp. LWS13-1.2]|uniref:Glycosyl hydrolase-related protein n=1 Tax=Microbacterium sp. LWS13-1.2 TaxID=3135264 RepID=A0AAU6SE68_9MICO
MISPSGAWFRLSGRLREGWSPQHTEIVCDLGFTADRPGFQVEGLAYRPDGSILKAVSPRGHHLPLDADAVAEGYRLNRPARPVVGDHAAAALFAVRSETVVTETVKLADDASGDVILRLYESAGGRGSVSVTALFDAARCGRTDLLERATGAPWVGPSTTLELRPFEIVTLRYRPAAGRVSTSSGR